MEPSPAHLTVRLRALHSARFVAGGIVLNLVLGVVKLAGGVLGNSYALIADAAESLLDVLSSTLVWGGFRIAARPPDADHPYGHGKASALAGLLIAAVIFSAVAGIAWQSIQEILQPHHAPHWLTLPLLALVVAAKEIMSRRMLRVNERYRATGLQAEAWHHRSDALTSAAAFIGIAIAVLGGPGYEEADDWAALAACVIISANGVNILRAALREIMDTAVAPEVEAEVRRVAGTVRGVHYIEKCRVLKSGLSLLVDIHVQVDGALTVRDGHEIAHAVKDALVQASLAVTDVAVHIEPAGE
ncbi:MAG: cobalt-zinc-cadmium resistance protein [Verrucomicrobia bacterium RIFCSPLOWO2_12_FULL_64_8]|nr:MAG: cobalt-zinc-cadmium resistance protein [Verrucomicrobia bacterium RIFCSPLOWO2_12_FULL_64_8]